MSAKDDENAGKALAFLLLCSILYAIGKFVIDKWIYFIIGAVAIGFVWAVHKYGRDRSERIRSEAITRAQRRAALLKAQRDIQKRKEAEEARDRAVYLERYSVVKQFPSTDASIIIKHDKISLVRIVPGPDRRYNDHVIVSTGVDLIESLTYLVEAFSRARTLALEVKSDVTAIEKYTPNVSASACGGLGFVTFFDMTKSIEDADLAIMVVNAESLITNYDKLVSQAAEAALRPYYDRRKDRESPHKEHKSKKRGTDFRNRVVATNSTQK